MRKKALLLGALFAFASFFAIKKHQQKTTQLWFTLVNIQVNEELHMISGECIEGTYTGEMNVYLPESIELSTLKNGMSVKVLGGPGITLSLPAQLMNCTNIEILHERAE